jgi:murein DD-endopeptidase
MGIKWDAVFQNEKKQFENMTEQQRFVYFLLLQFNSPYGWGKENPESSDCSGAVCLALYAATGLLIRTTADDLYKRVFTVKNPGAGLIRAAFFVSNKAKAHGNRRAEAGEAVHVAGLVDEGIILNSQDPGGRVRNLAEIAAWYERNGASMTIRGLDRAALEKLAREGKTRYDLDGEFSRYIELAL